jgi:hypothetical protein
MYILIDYKLILTKDRPDLSSEKADPRTALGGPAAIVNYRPDLSSEKVLQNNKPATF